MKEWEDSSKSEILEMTTMNLRTRSYGSKAMKNAKKAEKLPAYSGVLEDSISEDIAELYKKVIDETGTYFQQTEAIRQLIQSLDFQHNQYAFLIWYMQWHLLSFP